MNLIKLERGSVGNKPCPVCRCMHPAANKCEWNVLARRISLLEESNSKIPEILRANAAAVDTAKSFQALLIQADQANTILAEVLARHGEKGQEIQTEYLQELDKWAKEFSSQSTKQSEPTTGPLILSETNAKDFTAETKLGDVSQLDFSK